MTKPVRSFDVPGARLCIETMQSWIEGEPVPSYDRIIEVWGREFMDWRRQWREDARTLLHGEETYKKRINRELALYEVRLEYVGRYGFAIPCKELMDALREAGPIIEVAAGSGYMTRLMRAAGIDVIGSDYDWRGPGVHGFQIGQHDDEQVNGVEAKTMVRRYPGRAVFCSWPTLNHSWFRQMLRAMRIGQELIVIREEACAEDSAWQYIDDCFEERGAIELPVFPALHDYAGIYVKRRQNAQAEGRTTLLGRNRSLPRRARSGERERASKAAR